MKRSPTFETEADLCKAFIAWAEREKYICYPETAGFDILMVDKDGFQTGVEAKLRFNITVLSQALPRYNAETGPDYRAVLVPESMGDWRELCAHLGLGIFYCTTRGYTPRYGYHCFARDDHYLEPFDWNPVHRCKLPEYMPDVPAGVPSPVILSEWKIGALKVLARIEVSGWITRREISGFGIDPRRWTSGDGWLVPFDGDPKRGGRWTRGKCPAFDQQHPEVYARIKAEIVAAGLPLEQYRLESA